MPRGQKSKHRARERRHQARSKAQQLEQPEATTAEEASEPSTSSAAVGGASPSSSTSGLPQEPQRARSYTTRGGARGSGKRSGKGAQRQGDKRQNSPGVAGAGESARSTSRDPVSRKAGMLMQFLLFKNKMQQPIKRVDMLKLVTRRFRQQFSDILKIASERLELVFGLELKEVKPRGQIYTLVAKLEDTSDGGQDSVRGFPRNGLLMPLLGVIFLNGNSATEEEIWEFLNVLGVYEGKSHEIFGEPRKLITEDLVNENYLEYQQVPNSNPPCYQFRWGPRAFAETSKMKVLQFLAKVNNTELTAFPTLYEEAMREEEERAQVQATSGTTTKARRGPKAKRAAALSSSEG
ncbi:melanoma-associated antigen B2 [Ochotona princeps]|uniref:melanoma-associated antigen B2 n=1 Tax=Ochotona princeps TaxID=9978 RepID=UPI002715511E|nr:melanoma-associated antigen B2 [Ochotona princeps]